MTRRRRVPIDGLLFKKVEKYVDEHGMLGVSAGCDFLIEKGLEAATDNATVLDMENILSDDLWEAIQDEARKRGEDESRTVGAILQDWLFVARGQMPSRYPADKTFSGRVNAPNPTFREVQAARDPDYRKHGKKCQRTRQNPDGCQCLHCVAKRRHAMRLERAEWDKGTKEHRAQVLRRMDLENGFTVRILDEMRGERDEASQFHRATVERSDHQISVLNRILNVLEGPVLDELRSIGQHIRR